MSALDDILTEAADEASTALLKVYELAYDRLSGKEQEAISTVRNVCNEIVDGER